MPKRIEGEAVSWGDGPQKPGEPTYKVVSPKKYQHYQCLIVTHPVQLVLTHFYDDRTHPHLQDPSRCPGCQMGYLPKWKGYIGVWFPVPGRIAIQEITQGAMSSCPELLRKTPTLIGCKLDVRRLGDSDRGKVQMELFERVQTATFPKPFDVRAAMVKFWNVEPNPLRGQQKQDAQRKLEEDLRRAMKDPERWD